MKQQIIQKWEIHTESGSNINAKVPGDITADLFRAGKIADPLWGMNHKDLRWIINLSNLTSTTEGVTRLATENGLTVVTLDFKNISLDSGDTWLTADRATSNLTKVAMLCNNDNPHAIELLPNGNVVVA